MARPAQPDDLYRLRIASEPRLAPDGSRIAFTVQIAAPRRDGYRHSVWVAPVPDEGQSVDVTAARQVTNGGKHDRSAAFSPDGRWLAFLSDRPAGPDPDPAPRGADEGATQVWLLPLDGGDARRLTDLPLGADGFEWSPTGDRLVVSSASRSTRAARRSPAAGRSSDAPPTSDIHYVDRLGYMLNGAGFTYHRRANLWVVDVRSGTARRVTSGATDESRPAWSPDGTQIAFEANRRRDPDLVEASDVFVLDVATGRVIPITGGGRTWFGAPAWLPDGRTIAAVGHRYPARAGSRSDAWLFAADGSDAGRAGGRNLSGRHDLMLGAALTGDVVPGAQPRLAVTADGAWITFTAPQQGAYELWRIATADGRVERLTSGRHAVTGWDQVPLRRGGTRIACFVADTTHPSDLYVLDVARRGASRAQPARLTALNDEALADIALVTPVERRWEVDGRPIQGWLYPAIAATPDRARGRKRSAPAGRTPAPPLVTEIHGGPHAFYGLAPMWEFQVLAGAGMSVLCSNPRGSEGYGEAFNAANFRDWDDGPMRDVLAGVDQAVADGLADPDRLGLTGGSYGGYLTTWTIAHDQRFRAAMTCRSVADMTTLMLTGDISNGWWGRLEFGATPWDDPDYYRSISPLAYAADIHTPLLIQHAEKDIRTTIGQAEALFTVLRSLRRPVRLMRVPEETHELTRSGTPFRRVENLAQVRDWFAHFLVRGRRGLPPVPRQSAAR